MKPKYLVFKKYMGNFDGYLKICESGMRKFHEYTVHRQYATQFTLKQASKICFDKSKEARDSYSYYYSYGYEMVTE